MNKKLPSIRNFKLTRLRLAIITLAVLAIVWIVIQETVFRPASCQKTMCPVNDYTYLWKIAAVIILSSLASWLVKPNHPSQ